MTATTSALGSAPNSVCAPSMRARLRAATASLHAQVDARMPLAQAEPGLGGYLDHLLVMRDWLDVLAHAAPDLPGLELERAAVRQDAQQAVTLLGRVLPGPSPDMGVAGERLADTLNGPHADAARWGVRYVIEGSHLGGQVLQRRLAAALAPHPLGYLMLGAPGGWTLFLHGLSAREFSSAEQDAACRAAVQAFEALIDCLSAHHARMAA